MSNNPAGEGATPPASADTLLAKKGEAKLMLSTIILLDIQLKLGGEIIDSHPHIIYSKVKAKFAANNNTTESDRLRRKADSTTIQLRESLHVYIEWHMYIRRDM